MRRRPFASVELLAMNLTEQGSPTRGLSARAALLAGARIVAFCISVLLPLVLVRKLTRADYGVYKLSFQILASACSLLGLQVSASAYYFMPRSTEKKQHIALNIILFHFLVSAPLALLFIICPTVVTVVFKTADVVPYIPFVGIAIVLWLVSASLETLAVANGDVGVASILIVIMQLTKTGLLIGAALLFGTVRGLILAAIVQGALQLVVMFFYLRKRFGSFWSSFDLDLFRAQLRNALPFGIGGLAYSALYDLHFYYVSHYFDPGQFAIYSVGCFQLPLLILMIDSIRAVLIPEVARLDRNGNLDAIIKVWMNSVRQLAFFFVPICTLLFLLRREFITVLFTTRYSDSIPIFGVNLLIIMLAMNLSGAVMRAFDDFRYFHAKLCLALMPVALIAIYVGIRLGGLTGAIVAVALVVAAEVTITSMAVARRLGMSYRDLHYLAPVKGTAKAAVTAGLLLVIAKGVFSGLSPSLILAFGSLVFGSTYLVVGLMTGAVTNGEKTEFRKLLQSVLRIRSLRVRVTPADS
jgi:O-antigen/teichoic acid export membrane protein